jgi:ABC-type sugar transport system substrate-binding protein
VLSYFHGINVLQSYHDKFTREDNIQNIEAALQAFDNIDIIFASSGDAAAVSYEASKTANRLKRANGNQLIITCMDDSNEVLNLMEEGAFACVATYTPLMADIAIRAAILIAIGEDVPQQIVLPPTPSITVNGAPLFGIETVKAADWRQYAFGGEV